MDEASTPEYRERGQSPGPVAVAPAPDDRRAERGTQAANPAVATVRAEDLEPHEGLRYIARLFKVLSVLLVLLLLGEVVLGLTRIGTEAIPTLLVEATRLVVFAAFLWGAGDIAMMLIESNHDLRAARILLGRLNGKIQRLTDIGTDEVEVLAANPSLRGDRSTARRPDQGGGDGSA